MIFMNLDKDGITANQTFNFDPEKIPKNILKEWHINSSFQLLLNNTTGNTPNDNSMADELF